MELCVRLQLYAVLCSMLTGLICGVVYDILRIARRRLGFDTALDILYCLFVLFLLFTLGMDMGGGELHIIMLLAAAAAFALYMSVLSQPVLHILSKMVDCVGILLRPAKSLVKKLDIIAKKLFSNAEKRFRILKKSFRKADDPDYADQNGDGDNTCTADSLCGTESGCCRKRSRRGAVNDR